VYREEVIWAGWVPTNYESGIFASADLAQKQAYADYPWVRILSEDEPSS
jgi:hypothetical protein